MTSSKSQPVCLITGGSSGIGLACAQRFAAEGYRIAICGRDQAKLDAAKDLIVAQADPQGECWTRQVDLNHADQARQLGVDVLEHFGQVDVLINNAGVAPLSTLEDLTETQFESTLDVNVRSVFYLTQQVWRSMKQREQGTIVNISSMSAVDPFPGFSLYGASKAWLDLMTLALAAEGEPAGIRVCSIRPGAVETPLLRRLFPDFPADQCVAPQQVADVAWSCVVEPEKYPSGTAIPVTNQPLR